jgi:hypothetical protein
MRYATSALTGAVLAGGLTVAGLAPAQAGLLTWDLSTTTGNLGTTSSYTAGGYTITATGWLATDCGSPNYCFPVTPTALWGKADGGDESGLGIANDPSNDHEIYYPALVQIDVSQPYAAGLHNYQFEMGSTTAGEAWSVAGSNTPISDGNPGALLYNQVTDELTIHDLSGYQYYWFLYTGPTDGSAGGDNVLLYKTFSAVTGVPESSTWAMMLLGFAGYRKAKGPAVFAA